MKLMIRSILFLALLSVLVACSPGRADQESFLIVSQGQSNMGRDVHNWTPPSNLYDWSFVAYKQDPRSVGRFVKPSTQKISVALAFAAAYAREHPSVKVYLIDMAVGGIPIASWKPNPTTYPMQVAIAGNLPAAIKAAKRKPDVFLWWQGESDAALRNKRYPIDFVEMIGWHIQNKWINRKTPVLIFGITPWINSVFTGFNNTLIKIAARNWHWLFVDTPSFPKTAWKADEAVPYIHMTVQGRINAGELAYRKWRER